MNQDKQVANLLMHLVDFFRISVKVDRQMVTLDDGSGFSAGKKEIIEKMLINYAKTEQKLEENSVGLLNVQKRIKLLCGKEYGLSYTENENGGVTAHLLLPLKEAEQ